MKTIFYYACGSIEETIHADKHIAAGRARLATPEEVRSYNGQFGQDDQRIAQVERLTAGQKLTRAYLTPGGVISDYEE